MDSGSTLLELLDFQVLDRGTNTPLTGPIDLKIRPGTVHLLKGPNGIGKSSLIRSLTNETFYKGKMRKASGLTLVSHPQISAPMFALPLRLSDILSWSRGTSDELSEAALRLIGSLNLNRSWDSCSGGERQRVLLATLFSKALFSSKAPTLLLLDEPMNHLDEGSQVEVIAILREWLKDRSAQDPARAVVLVTHEEVSGLECEVLNLRAASRLEDPPVSHS